MRKLNFLILITIVLMSFASLCFAKEINFEVSVDSRRVSLDKSIVLSLTFHGTQSIPAPDLSGVEGFHVRYVGPLTMMSIVNGRMSASITHKYLLIPQKAGEFQLGPFSFEYRGDTYTAPALTVEVSEGPVRQKIPRKSTAREEFQADDRIFLVMETGKSEAYLNELIPLTVKLYIDRLSVRDIQYPKFASEGFSTEPFPHPRQYEERLGGVIYDVIEFNTAIFGTRVGTSTLGPAELKCNIIRRERSRRSALDDFFGDDSFFGRYTKHPINLVSRAVPITILPLPEEGKPGGFTGAVGNFDFTVEAQPEELKVGDPITLKMTVNGDGNFKTVDLPSVDFGDNFKVYDPEITQDRKGKTFKQAIVPKDPDVKEVPKIGFSFFDPGTEKYKRVAKGPIPIKVNPLPKGEELKIFELPESGVGMTRKKEILGRDIIYIKDNPGKFRQRGEFLYKNKLFAVLQLIPVLAIISVSLFNRRRQRLRTDIRYARRLRASGKARKNLLAVRRLLSSGEQAKFFDAVFKTLQEYIGDKFHLPTAGITSDIVAELRTRGVDEEVLDKLKKCFEACDTARYAPSGLTKEQMHSTFELLHELIDKFERMRI